MPSHSGSRGNFSSGGSRGGFGMSFGGGRSYGGSGFHRPPRRPWHFHFFGSPVVISTGSQSGFVGGIFMFIFTLIISIICFGVTGNSNAKVKEYTAVQAEIQADSKAHLEIIEKAENGDDGYGFTYAEFDKELYSAYSYNYENNVDRKKTGAYEYITDLSGLPKYYIIYEFEVGGTDYKGETFAEFMSSEVHLMNGKIRVAYHITSRGVDSINADYDENKNFELFEAKEIISDAEMSVKVSKIIAFVSAGICGITVIILVLCFVHVVKKSKEQSLEEAEEKKAELEEKLDAKKKKYCIHCGSLVEDETKKCPNCGSSRFERK